jgi:glycosyltransferase involved in cell wall biosynthesis
METILTLDAPSRAPAGEGEKILDVSVVMPCLNEARTIATCIRKAHAALSGSGLSYEIVVGDNGSTDGSQELARTNGARVVDVMQRGYGQAYRNAIAAARGQVIVIGDSDDSYDFLSIRSFIDKVREGYDLVMGSRFKGGIEPGAMPLHHRYIGNPILTGILNLFFRAGISDAHCGMRAFTKAAYERLRLKTGGMEFASEMIIRAAQEGLRIAEIPTTLHKDGRDRPPHLRSFRDGWRHLRFMLLYSPTWLFMLPGCLFAVPGALLVVLLPFFSFTLCGHVLSFHFSMLGSLMTILGWSVIQLAVFAKALLVAKGIGESPTGEWVLRSFPLEGFLFSGFALAMFGAGVDGGILCKWVGSGLDDLAPQITSLATLASTAIIVGVQLLFSSFFLGIVRGALTDVWVD